MLMQYANVEKFRKMLGIRSASNSAILDSIPTIEIEAALEHAKEPEAVRVTRCKKCFWCIQSRGLREPLCTVPGRPAYHTTSEGYCNLGKERDRDE